MIKVVVMDDSSSIATVGICVPALADDSDLSGRPEPS
jgi:hypothetical protein